MDGLKQWALCLIISAAAVTLVTVISPSGSTDKTVRAVAGIFVVSAIFTPVADISFDFSSMSAMAEYDVEQSDNLSDSVLEACKIAAENAILSAADKRGATVKEICINADIDTDSCIIIHGITVKVGAENTDKKSELSLAFANAAGVPVEVIAE